MTDCQDPPGKVELNRDEAHVWSIFWPTFLSHRGVLARLLSSEETIRAERFKFPLDRDRFIVIHGMMRVILGRYARVSPASLRLHTDDNGKPFLPPDDAGLHLFFNLSHSSELGVLAICAVGPVGIDVEKVNEQYADEEIARYFSPGEIIALQSLPPESRADGFFHCWTRKEAYLKARGDGLSFPLDQFEVSVAASPSGEWLRVDGDNAEGKRWRLFSFSPTPGYLAALVVEHAITKVGFRQAIRARGPDLDQVTEILI